jgi:hypothetical protein
MRPGQFTSLPTDSTTSKKEFEGRGAKIHQGIVPKPWGNRDFRVSDDSGNELKFMETLPEVFRTAVRAHCRKRRVMQQIR